MQIASITTNEQGEYEYATEKDYPEQTLDFVIQKEGFETKNISYEIDKAEIKSDILLNELEKGTKEKTRIFGIIRNSKNRDPVKAASITLSIEGTKIAAITSDDMGGYEYTAEEDYSGHTLDYVIQKEGFIRKDISHEIDRFEIKSDILMDEIEIKIKGKICDETDSPLDNASISFSIGNSTINLNSDKEGSFSFNIGQQFLNQIIGYEANKEGFKIKSGKLKLIEDLRCINLSEPIPDPVPNPDRWKKIAAVGIVLTGVAIVLFAIQTSIPTPAASPANNPPESFIDSINPSPGLQGQSVTFIGHGDDLDSGDSITEYKWESNIDGYLSDQKTFSTSSLTSGLHKITLQVKDSHEQWSSEITENLRVKIYLHEDFESGMPENWLVGPTYESAYYKVIKEPESENHVLLGHGHAHINPNIGQEWDDYSFQVNIKLLKDQIEQEPGCNLIIRQRKSERYFIEISFDTVSISRSYEDYSIILIENKATIPYNEWNKVKVVCKGNLIKVFVNDDVNPVIKYTDNDNPLKNGRIDLETWDDQVYYDDILVEELD